jgi:hypothetical protein
VHPYWHFTTGPATFPQDFEPAALEIKMKKKKRKIIQLLSFWMSSIPCFSFKTQHFIDWILSPFSGKSILSWAQSIDLVPICGGMEDDIQSGNSHSLDRSVQ